MNNLTIGNNISECIKEVRNITNIEYHNICDNTVDILPWGVEDVVVLFCIIVLCVLLAYLFTVIHNVK